jgi:hypothetical protein
LQLVYNGRNDIAESIINLLLGEIGAGKDPNFNIATVEGLIALGDFILRTASELTPVVGPPFSIFLINRSNEIRTFRNTNLSPLGREVIQAEVRSSMESSASRGPIYLDVAVERAPTDNQNISIPPTGIAFTPEIPPNQSGVGTVTIFPIKKFKKNDTE